MSVIGVIYVAWQSEDYLADSLSPWIAARAAGLGGHDYLICAVSVPFVGFAPPVERDRTVEQLSIKLLGDDLDYLTLSDAPLTEVAARGMALTWLVAQGVDYTWMVDADEIYTEDQILAITRYVADTPLVASYRLSLRNYVFTKDQYLAEPFTPTRIHQVRHGIWRADSFWDDNNVMYAEAEHPGGPPVKLRDVYMAELTIPISVAWIRHETWMNDLRSRDKIRYQVESRKWQCSYSWDEARGGLTFNEQYYTSRGLPLPTVLILPSHV